MALPEQRDVATRIEVGAFRGVEFLVKTESSLHGHKIAVHDYVNSNKRFVEQMGLVPAEFTLNAYVHTSVDNVNARDRRDAMISALNEVGSGTLDHPYYGIIDAKVGTYTVSSTDSNSGIIDFSIKFYTDDGDQLPNAQVDTVSNLQSVADDTRESMLDSALSSVSDFNKASKKTIQTLTEKVEEIASDFESIMNSATGNDSLIAQANGFISTLRRTSSQIALAPSQLFNTVNSFFGTVSGLTLTFETIIDSFIGSDDIENANDTVDRQYRNETNDLFNDYVNIGKSIAAFEQSASYSYDNSDQLDEVIDKINNQYLSVIESDLLLVTSSETPVSEDDVYNPTVDTNLGDSLYDLFIETKNTAIKILNNVEVSNSNIDNINIYLTSAAVLTYQRYGSLDNINVIARINNDQSLSNISGSANIISDG